jgi:hypothetical protein
MAVTEAIEKAVLIVGGIKDGILETEDQRQR